MPEDGRRHEVLDGDWVVTPSPTTTHQTISKNLLFALMVQLEKTQLAIVLDAPTDVIFSNTRVTVPDVLVVARERRDIIKERGIEGAPDLIVEITLPSTAKVDRETKRKLYADAGVREYWIVDPKERSIEILGLAGAEYNVLSLIGADGTATSAVFPFEVAASEVFRMD